VFPIVAGFFIYFAASTNLSIRKVSNYLPDGLWAYAFSSCILIIWDRKVNLMWMAILGCLFVVFELLQSINFLKGTGDTNDIFTYFIFGLLSLKINQILKPNSLNKSNKYDKQNQTSSISDNRSGIFCSCYSKFERQ
jgi:hypothetical protein